MSQLQEHEHEQQSFATRLAQALRAHETLDADTAARLRQARQRALAHAGRFAWQSWMIPASALAAGLLVLLLVPRKPIPEPVPPQSRADEMELLELLADEREPEFYQDLRDNAEFYRWLASEARVTKPHV